jgi:hypothetical protein
MIIMASVVRRRGIGKAHRTNIKLLKGKPLARHIQRIAKYIDVDLSKANYAEARRILKGQSLSRDLIRMRQSRRIQIAQDIS